MLIETILRSTFVLITAFATAITVSAEDPTRIYVYARRDTAARSWLPISCDNGLVAEVKQGFFFAIDTGPGRHALVTAQGVPLSVDLAVGKEVYLRLDWNYGTGRPPIPLFSQVDPADAQREMKYLSYAPVKRLRSSLVSKADPRTETRPQLRTR